MLDPLLRRFVEATDQPEAERELNALIEEHAFPLAKAIVGRRLGSYREDSPGRAHVLDRDDVVADAMVMLVERLQGLRAGPDPAPIENFINYSAAVVYSACAHHIRRRYPERARLKNRLRYVFSTGHRLALWWRTDDDQLVCGLAEWRDRLTAPATEQTLVRLLAGVKRPRTPWATISSANLTAATVDLMTALGGPVEFETFVSAAASAAGIIEPSSTGDTSTLAARSPAHDVVIDQRRFLARVWDEIGRLPLRQRVALLLNLRDTGGGGLLWLLPVAGVATIKQIARVLEIPEADFARLWHEIPLDDVTIGQRLGCGRQQVINLRIAARRRLMSRVGERTGLRPVPARRHANLRQVSASLKGGA